jgi:hypothetical protein
LLGVISERFPKGGALALGISGGVGMMSAGLLGGPGLGYKQDFFAVQALQESSPSTYDRYVARNEQGELAKKPFPLVTSLFPNEVPPIAGLDNAKLKVFDDFGGVLADRKAGKTDAKTTLESDLETLRKEKEAGKPVEPKLEENLTRLYEWWTKYGLPHYDEDKKPLNDARLEGAKTALTYTAFIPAALAIGFMLLILYFAAVGGYKQVHIEDGHGGNTLPGTPR